MTNLMEWQVLLEARMYCLPRSPEALQGQALSEATTNMTYGGLSQTRAELVRWMANLMGYIGTPEQVITFQGSLTRQHHLPSDINLFQTMLTL